LDVKLAGHLERKRREILGRWRLLIVESYPPETARFLEREKDQIANPVGHFIRSGTRDLFDQASGGMDPAAIRTCIDPLVRIRAVQDFRPSEAIDVVFMFKRAVRAELAQEIARDGLEAQLLDFESRIDEIAKIAFDTYAGCREQLYEIRIRDIKNRSAVLMRRMNSLGGEPPVDEGLQGGEA
jgi:hypothetical protein